MKRLFFSAILMMAFMGSAFANNVKVEVEQAVLIVEVGSCEDQATNEVNVAEAAYHEATSVNGQPGQCFDSWVYN